VDVISIIKECKLVRWEQSTSQREMYLENKEIHL